MSSFHLKSSFTFLLFYFLFSYVTFSQKETFPNFQTIDEENGLSDNNVQCIYKDQRGFMWVGTKSGLNLIDGSTISVFKNVPNDKNSISNNIINCITSDSNGHLWIGTQQGLNSFDPIYRYFTAVPLNIKNSSQNNNVTSIAINKENTVFIASYSGLFIYDEANRKMTFTEIPGDDYEKLLNNRITHICFDKKGILYLSTFNGLWSYDVIARHFTHEISSKNDPQFTSLFTNFIIDHSGELWIGTWDKGLKKFDPEKKTIINYPLTDNVVFNIQSLSEIKQPDGSWIILLNNKLRYFDPEKGKLVNSFTNPVKNFDVSVLFTSGDNWVWIGTNKGLFFYNPSRNFILHNRFVNSISSQGISLLEWQKNILVGGSNQSFLKLYDEDLNEKKDFSKQIGGNQISCLAMQISGDNMIKCGTSEGIADINLLTGTIHFHQLQETGLVKAGSRFITALLKDSKKVWWIFPWRNGIWVTDSSTQNTRQVFNNFLTEYNIPKPLVIGNACEDKNTNIWFGDYDEGVIFFDRNKNHFSKPFEKYLGSKNAITQIIYHNGYCYSFFYNNLLMWNVDNMLLHQTRLPEAIDKSVTSIALDSSGNLWMSTQSGLIAYNMSKKIFRHFTTSDGLLSNAMNGTLYCCKNGTMVYACPEYISSFKPGELLKGIGLIPHIELSEVIVNGKPYFFNVLKKQYFNHNAYNFIFKWTVTDYSNPMNNHYSYKLEGIDKDWRLAGKEGKIEFANLSPGDYTLLLKAENSNGVSADKILKLQFVIQLPFWKTWWFLILLFLLFGFFFYSLLRYRINQLKKIEKLRNEISLNLHDDIGSTLSSISILSDIALHDKKDNDAMDMLKEIKENSLSMMERMDDIVWSINPRNDSLENLFLRIKSFAAKLFEAKEINYKINISDEIRHIHLEMEFRQHIYLIMKEAINNIVKYSNCNEANINIDYNASQLTMVLKDNGKGFDMEKASYGNGLNNMKKRAKEINAEINIVSKINEGTKITLVAKIK